jgi:hypothetical protein
MKARLCGYFMHYVRRCADKKPVIWYDGLESYIFVDNGVYKMAADFHVNEFKIFVWTLGDSDQAKDGIPPELVRNRTRLFVLYASSSNKQRWKRFHKGGCRRSDESMELEEILRAYVCYTDNIHLNDHIV